MGKVADFASLQYLETSPGIRRAAFTGSDMTQVTAEIVRLSSGSILQEGVPAGSDRYYYALAGEAAIAVAGTMHEMPQDSFAAVQEGMQVTITARGENEVILVSVTAAPKRDGDNIPGFSEKLRVSTRATQPFVDVPEQKKRRTYFVGKESSKSERAHAMIVDYVSDTVTGMHMHPNAESMFIMLNGKVCFNIEGRDAVVGRGQAAFFRMSDRHSLRVAEGDDVNFLEFHLPAAFTTVRG